MIVHIILCLNEREIEKKEKKIINQEDQISELTFNFHGALSILTFSKNELTIFTKKSKRKTKKKRKKRRKKKEEKENRGEMRRKKIKKEKRKAFVCTLVFEKSILCDLMKNYILIPLFTN